MAKDSKGTFQFVFLNLEGDEETIQEAVRQAGVILNRGMNPAQPTRTLIAVPVPTSKALGNGSQNGVDPNAEQIYEVVDVDAPATNGEASPSSAATTTAKQKRERKAPRIPAILKDFDPNTGEMSFADFVNQKDTSNQFSKYLVVAAWFKKYRDVAEITPSHIYTCYQIMKWTAPDNMSQPFHDMKRLHSYFERGSKSGAWAITIIGLNEVDKMRAKTDMEE